LKTTTNIFAFHVLFQSTQKIKINHAYCPQQTVYCAAGNRIAAEAAEELELEHIAVAGGSRDVTCRENCSQMNSPSEARVRTQIRANPINETRMAMHMRKRRE